MGCGGVGCSEMGRGEVRQSDVGILYIILHVQCKKYNI